MHKDDQLRVVIIGGGPAAIEAAKTAQLYSNNIKVISDKPIGNWSKLGWSAGIIELCNEQLKWKDILNKTEQKLENWSDNIKDYFAEKKIETIIGRVNQVNPENVVVHTDLGEKVFPYDKLFIAVGSSPVFPNGFEPDGKFIFSPQSIKSLEELPSSILLIGNGPISYEYASIFNYFGVQIKWLVPEEGPFTPFDSIIHTHLNRLFINRGIEFIKGPFIKKIEIKDNKVIAIRENATEYTAEKAFFSIGFRSNIHSINFDGFDFQTQDGNIFINKFGQTSYENIYVVGDARNANSASLSMQQGRLSVIHAFEQHKLSNFHIDTPMRFSFNPQVGVVGTVDEKDEYLIANIDSSRFKTSSVNPKEELIKMTYTSKGVIKSAVVIGEHASELINLIALAINFNITITELSNFYTAHPSYSEAMLTIIREIELQLRSKSLAIESSNN